MSKFVVPVWAPRGFPFRPAPQMLKAKGTRTHREATPKTMIETMGLS